MAAGGTKVRPFAPGQSAAEFVFVPNAPDAAEDDGVLMGFVQDVPNGRTDLLVLDSQTLEDVAAVHLPVRVPAAFHGNWVPTP
jgi:carotenoid cleavage dioxygenase